MKKLRVAVLYGGNSGEHEVSTRSAASVIQQLDRTRYDVLPVGIDKLGHWHLNPLDEIFTADIKTASVKTPNSRPINVPQPGAKSEGFDVIFPVMHGPLYEDGSIQGLLRLADIPVVGPDVLGAAISMDKVVSKKLVAAHGISVVPYCALDYHSWRSGVRDIDWILTQLAFPLFVKPVSLGSSVGTYKVNDSDALSAAIEAGFRFENKLIIEKALRIREIELSVLENITEPLTPDVSLPGEIIVDPKHAFYSYEAKYLDKNGASLAIPASLTPAQIAAAQSIAREAFCVLQSIGMARVDLFLEKDTGQFYFNELNSIPGFTEISMYPKLWEASGMPYPVLLTKLIDLALAHHALEQRVQRDYHN